MAKDVTYTSTSISKTHLVIINELKQFVQDQYGVSVTSQQINDFAVEKLNEAREELKNLADAQITDPEVRQFLKLQAKLAAAGKLPK